MTKLGWLAVVLLGCSGAQAPVKEPAASARSSGEQCREAAAAGRQPAPEAPAMLALRHILVRHADLKDPRGATRSPTEACLRALAALKRLESGASWGEVVSAYSDSKDDSLGRVAYDDLSKSFADAAFALEPEQLSYVVESDRGFHIILRE